MIKLTQIGTYLPDGGIDNFERMEMFNIDETFIETKTGVAHASRKSPDQETSDLCVAAFQDLCAGRHIDVSKIDCIVVCTQNPDSDGIPHVSAIVHGKLGLSETCASFDISLGCSGYVYGLSLVSSFMEANDLRKGLFFTADPYSKIIDMNDKNTSLLFGDGATVSLLEADNSTHSGFLAKNFCFFSRGSSGGALCVEDGHLTMNGRAVFTFSATEAPKLIDATLAKAGIGRGDIDLYLVHQGSRYIVDTIRGRLGVEEEKVPVAIRDYGNTVSSSIPMMLRDYLDHEDVSKILLCGFGVGLSAASCILTREP